MGRPQVLTPAWFVLLAVIAGLGGILSQAMDVYLFDRGDESFRWGGALLFAVTMFVLQVGLALWSRRKQRAQGLS